MEDEKFIQLKTNLAECCFISIPKKGRRAIWELTHYCPQSCYYCFTSSSKELNVNKNFLKKNKIKIISLFKELGVKDILLTGGEPLSAENEILDIAARLKRNEITYSISTTGKLENYLKKVCNLKPRRINVSFDPRHNGSDPWKSNRNFLENTLNIISQKEIPIKLTGVISRDNVKSIPEYMKMLNDIVSQYELIQKIALTHEYPIGRGISDKGLSLKELKKVYETIQSHIAAIPVDVFLINWPSFNDNLQRCPAGKSIFSIMPNGDITPCSLLYYLSRVFKIGNILQSSQEEMKEVLSAFNKGVERHIREVKTWNTTCRKCKNKRMCGGGCFATMPVLMFDHRERVICKIQPAIITDEQKQVFANIEKPLREDYVIPEASGQYEELDSELEKKIVDFIKNISLKSDLAHNFEHIKAVVKLGRHIARKEKANEKIVVTACYFHDASPRNSSMHHFHTLSAAKVAEDFLREQELSEDEIVHVKECIISSSYGSYVLGIEPRSIEAKIVRDADLLDAIGARGVARVFAFAGAHGVKTLGTVEYSPHSFPIIFEMNLTGPDLSPIHHFYTKLLKIKDLMLTSTGKELAKERHEFMVAFLTQYSKEDLGNDTLLQTSLDSLVVLNDSL